MQQKENNQVKGTYPFGSLIPKWGVFVFDTLIATLAFVLALFVIQLDFQGIFNDLSLDGLVVIASFMVSFLIFKPYKVVIRFFTAKDLLLIIYACVLSFILLLLWSFFQDSLIENYLRIFLTVILAAFLLITYRIIVSAVRRGQRKVVGSKGTIIFGAGRLGQVTKDLVEGDLSIDQNVLYFVDDNANLHYKKCKDIMVYPPNVGLKMASENKVGQVIIAIKEQDISSKRKTEFINACLEQQIPVKKIAEPKNWAEDNLDKKNIVDLKLEDLLERNPIQMNTEKINSLTRDKVIFVTGAAGSIGSEIVNQLLNYLPSRIILIDQAESGLYELVNRLKAPNTELLTELADVTDLHRIAGLFDKYKPNVIFHAAAYKHVPMMEKLPYEAVKVNIGGTKNIVDCAVKAKVEKFVFVSTDKAVNPTNVMGATKRVCELYVQAIAKSSDCHTEFITTRFGNVLGSSGSVVPIFRRQISEGGPLTVTHREITRYFMTIPEACQLVLEAAITGKNGEIYIFDMGNPVKIYNLAKKMINLSGLVLGKDIEIEVTGLRPGEKLYEELLASEETTLPTHHEKIFKAITSITDFEIIKEEVQSIVTSNPSLLDTELVSRLRNMVPEYEPQNTRFAN